MTSANPASETLNESSAAPKKKSGLGPYIFLGVVFSLIALGALYLVLRIMGSVWGAEFSPDDFTTRSFSYEIMPVTGWTMRGIHYENTTPEVCELIVADKLITFSTPLDENWVLTRDYSNDKPGGDCDARFLVDELNRRNDEGNSFWSDWTEKHPKCAKVFWPIVAEMARNDMYLAVPDIMRFVKRNVVKDDDQKLKTRLEELSALAYFDLGVMEQQKGVHDQAVKRLTRSIEISPTKDAYQARANSYDALGKSSLAQSDRLWKDEG